jgi:hypothetical protein
MSSVEVEGVKVPMNGTDRSNAKISTNDLGPCIAFLLTFTHNGENTAVLTHYAHSMQNKRKICGLIGKMIRVIDFLASKTFGHFSKEDFTNERSVVSNFHLLVTGGEPINGQWIHNALALLNAKLFFPIETICEEPHICFFYNQLIDHVTIVKFVFKMLHPKEEEGEDGDDEEDKEEEEDDDDKEAEHGDWDDGENDDEENDERSKEDKHGDDESIRCKKISFQN